MAGEALVELVAVERAVEQDDCACEEGRGILGVGRYYVGDS